MFCPECGKQLRDDAIFCSSCGKKIVMPQEIPVQESRTVSSPQKTYYSQSQKGVIDRIMQFLSEQPRHLIYAGGALLLLLFVILIAAISRSGSSHSTAGALSTGNSSYAATSESSSAVASTSTSDSSAYAQSGAAASTSQNSSAGGASSTVSPANEPLEWNNLVTTTKDLHGYEFRKTMVISPWIPATDTDTIQRYWSEVSDDEFLGKRPTMWSNGGDGETYYAIGYFMQENITSGFDITELNPYSVPLEIYAGISVNHYTIGMSLVVYYSNGYRCYRNFGSMPGKMLDNNSSGSYITLKSNKWGAVPICFVAYNPKSPNLPDGLDLRLAEFRLNATDEPFFIDVLE